MSSSGHDASSGGTYALRWSQARARRLRSASCVSAPTTAPSKRGMRVTSLGVTVRHVLDRARRLTAGLAPNGRWPLAVAMAAGVLVSAAGPTAPARADTPSDPAARLQIVLKSIHIYDDRDWFGRGEMAFAAGTCHL